MLLKVRLNVRIVFAIFHLEKIEGKTDRHGLYHSIDLYNHLAPNVEYTLHLIKILILIQEGTIKKVSSGAKGLLKFSFILECFILKDRFYNEPLS